LVDLHEHARSTDALRRGRAERALDSVDIEPAGVAQNERDRVERSTRVHVIKGRELNECHETSCAWSAEVARAAAASRPASSSSRSTFLRKIRSACGP